MKKNVLWALPLVVANLGCDQLTPKITVQLAIVEPCDQKSMADLDTIEVKSETPGGAPNSTRVSKSSGQLDLTELTITDGTMLFANGFIGATSSTANAAGATPPLPLSTYDQNDPVFPATRSYPASDTNQKIYVPMGRVRSFGKTTDGAEAAKGNAVCTPMVQGRHAHTATFIPAIGRVLIIGGLAYAQDGSETFVPRARAAELYDPITGRYTEAAFPDSDLPLMVRAFHTASLLPDGRVLVWGGVGPDGDDGTKVSPRAFSFIVNPSADGKNLALSTLSTAQGFQFRRYHHQATVLPRSNLVVITGGCGCVSSDLSRAQVLAGMCPPATDPAPAGCEISTTRMGQVDVFDIATSNIRTLSTGQLSPGRAFHSAVAVEDARGDQVVIVGGDDGNGPISGITTISRLGGSSELRFSSNDDLGPDRVTHAAAVTLDPADCARLITGNRSDAPCVLITGGCTSVEASGDCPDANIKQGSTILDFGQAAGSRVLQGPQLLRARWGHQAFALPQADDMVLLVGGKFLNSATVGGATDNTLVSAELLSRSSGAPGARPFTGAVLMGDPRRRFASTVFPSGQILVTGGELTYPSASVKASLGSGELYFYHYRP